MNFVKTNIFFQKHVIGAFRALSHQQGLDFNESHPNHVFDILEKRVHTRAVT